MPPSPRAPLGVGFLGAGPVTQAIHLPTLARLPDLFQVRCVMDVDTVAAATVAERAGARAVSTAEELLDDPSVDVVAVCSPDRFHADQVIAACRAGTKAILCEKPFATTAAQAREIARVAGETQTPIVVGTMHAYDAGWAATRSIDLTPHTIRVSAVLPPNDRFETLATEVLATTPFDIPDREDPSVVATYVRGLVLGLGIHDLPLVRELTTRVSPTAWQQVRVLSAEILDAAPGYLVVAQIGGHDGPILELQGVIGSAWQPDWRLEAADTSTELTVRFTPSYVQAGSATTTVSASGEDRTIHPATHNGYEAEWRELAAVVDGAPPQRPLTTLIDDVAFAVDFAEQAASVAFDAATARRASTTAGSPR